MSVAEGVARKAVGPYVPEAKALEILGVDRAAMERMVAAGEVSRFWLGPLTIRYAEPQLRDIVRSREQASAAVAPEPFRKYAGDHLYLLEILDVGSKFGISADPAHRLRMHASQARAFARSIGRMWVSIAHLEASQNEKAIQAALACEREYSEHGFDAVMEVIASLPMTRWRGSTECR